MTKFSFSVLVLFALSFGCQSAAEFDAYASEFCSCVQPLADVQERIMAMDEQASEADMTQLFADGQQADEDAQACLMSLQDKYADLDLTKEEEIIGAIKKSCPKIVELMQSSALPEEEMPMPEVEEQ